MKSRFRLDIKEYKRHRYTLTLLSRALFPCSSLLTAILAHAALATHPTTPGSHPTALYPVTRNIISHEMLRSAKPSMIFLNDVYLQFDLPGTFWMRYVAVNEAVMKLTLVPASERE